MRPVDWQGTPFDKLQVLPENARPVVLWRDRDEAFVSIVKGIRKIIDNISMTEKERQQQIEAEQARLAEEERLRRAEAEHRLQKESFWTKFLRATGFKHDDTSSDNIAFTLKTSDGNYKVIQGFFGESNRVSGARKIDYYKEIIQNCNNDLENNPNNAYAHYEKAHALKMSKNYSEALVAYEKAISLGFDIIEINHSKAKVLFQLARYKEAADIYEYLIQYNPNDAYINFSYAIVLNKLNKHERENDAYSRARKINPFISDVYQDEENALEENSIALYE